MLGLCNSIYRTKTIVKKAVVHTYYLWATMLQFEHAMILGLGLFLVEPYPIKYYHEDVDGRLLDYNMLFDDRIIKEYSDLWLLLNVMIILEDPVIPT